MKVILRTGAYLLLFVFMACGSSQNMKIIENDNGDRVALGECNGQQLLNHFRHYQNNFTMYMPDANAISDLQKFSEKVQIITVLGTWCPDSQREVPKFIKIMDEVGNPNFNIRFICVDRTKKDGKGITESYEIEYVPTFVVIHNGEEIGRIVESPDISMEDDLIHILQNISES